MSNHIKTGGVGKNPAIEKMNQLNEISSRVQAAAMLEKRAFDTQNERAGQELVRRKQIIEEFHISFMR